MVGMDVMAAEMVETFETFEICAYENYVRHGVGRSVGCHLLIFKYNLEILESVVTTPCCMCIFSVADKFKTV